MFKDLWITIPALFLVILGLVILTSIAPGIFPGYFIYVVLSIIAFWVFSQIPFEAFKAFSKIFYGISVFLLLLTWIIGSVTRGTIRWIPIGPLSLQPAELVRPFLLVFFASFLAGEELKLKKFFIALVLLAIPVILILIQPSLGVSVLTVIGFLGVVVAGKFPKKYLAIGAVIVALLLPLFWQLMAPYQKQRIMTFINPGSDPLGAGYNSLQSTIATGSGKAFGRGLGKGIQTQLAFLPEKQTDFIFAAVGEELGFVGASLLLLATLIILIRLTKIMENVDSPAARAYLSGLIFVYLAQVLVHVGMNMGILPVTGVPLPLVSAGGSSLLATMMGLGIAVGTKKV